MAALGRTGIRAALSSVTAGRHGPGMPGPASTFPGEYSSRASGFASGRVMDRAPGHPVLAQLAAEARPDNDRGPGDSEGPNEPLDTAPAGPLAGVIPPGFAGRVNLTAPLATLLGLADRPARWPGSGPWTPA